MRYLTALAALGLLLAVTTTAGANTWGTARIRHEGFGYHGIAGVNWDHDNDGVYEYNYNNNVYVGEYRFRFDKDHADSTSLARNLLSDPFYAFCTDLEQEPGGWATYDMVDVEDAPIMTLDSPMGEAKANDLREMFGENPPATFIGTDNQRAEAYGAAVWEVVFENENNAYDFDAGTLTINGWDGSAKTYAQTLLASITGDTENYDPDLFALTNANLQDMTLTVPGYGGMIPEPVTMAGLALGIGALGGYVRRRRT